MNIKLFLLKAVVKRNRSKLQKRLSRMRNKGEPFWIPRRNTDPVMTYLYRPACGGQNLPAIFNVHGGAWVGGDALLLDTQSQEMADRLSAVVVNINYIKADVKPFPYAQYEVRDTVRYFAEHAAEYSIDTQRLALMGYSAGGHLCACAAQMLCEDGVRLAAQVLCYPFLDFTFGQEDESPDVQKPKAGLEAVFFPTLPKKDHLVSPGIASDEHLKGVAPAIIVTCGPDPLKPQAEAYKSRLENVGIPVELLNYPDAVHGFLECNYPETEDISEAKSPEQAVQCRTAEQAIANELRKIWNQTA